MQAVSLNRGPHGTHISSFYTVQLTISLSRYLRMTLLVNVAITSGHYHCCIVCQKAYVLLGPSSAWENK